MPFHKIIFQRHVTKRQRLKRPRLRQDKNGKNWPILALLSVVGAIHMEILYSSSQENLRENIQKKYDSFSCCAFAAFQLILKNSTSNKKRKLETGN